MKKSTIFALILLFLPALTVALGTRISDGHYWQRDPAISGSTIVWSDLRDHNGEIYYYDINAGRESLLKGAGGDYNIFPSIHQGKVAYWHTATSRNPKASGIYLTDTQVDKYISATNIDCDGKTQVYGNHILWSAKLNGSCTIRHYDISTGNETALANTTATTLYPKIDGNRAVWSDRRFRSTNVFMYDFSTNQEIQITKGTASTSFETVAWAPDISGNKIVWWDRGGNPTNGRAAQGIYLYDILTGKETYLTATSASWTRPRIWGNKVLYANFYPDGTSPSSGRRELMMIDINSGLKTVITESLATFDKSFDIEDGIVAWEDNRDGDPGSIYYAVLAAGGIYGNTNPAGAIINIDLQDRGITPRTISPLAPGSHMVTFSKSGYSQVKLIVDVREGEITNITANLTPTTVPSVGPSGQPTGIPSPKNNPQIPTATVKSSPTVKTTTPIPNQQGKPDGRDPYQMVVLNPRDFLGSDQELPTASLRASVEGSPIPTPGPEKAGGLPSWIWLIAILAIAAGAFFVYQKRKEAEENSEE